MNKNIDLTKILKDCPRDWKLYSSIHGEVQFRYIDNGDFPIVVELSDSSDVDFTKDGKLYSNYDGECALLPSKNQRDWSKFTAPWYKKEKFDKKKVKPKFKVGDRIRHKVNNKDDVYEISKVYDDSYGIDDFNWMIYIKYQDQYELVPNKFDPKILQPFDKVLVRDDESCKWRIDFYSHKYENMTYPYRCIGKAYTYCIPYNEETKHLIETKDEAPEYYRYWEDRIWN